MSEAAKKRAREAAKADAIARAKATRTETVLAKTADSADARNDAKLSTAAKFVFVATGLIVLWKLLKKKR